MKTMNAKRWTAGNSGVLRDRMAMRAHQRSRCATRLGTGPVPQLQVHLEPQPPDQRDILIA